MVADWPRKSVVELHNAGILLVEDGNHGEYRPRQEEFGSGQWAFIRAADIDGGRVLFESAQKINDVAFRRIRKGIGKGGDVLFSHKGTVGKLALVPLDAPPFVCSPQTTFWRTLVEQQLDRRYLYCFMQSRAFREQWAARKSETDMADYVSLTAQRTFHVIVPPPGEQRAIAGVLGALDDKIEQNRRTSAALERLARAMFRAWFVDFEPVKTKAAGATSFPSMPKDIFDALPPRLVDSELGPVPEGWTVGKLGDIALERRETVDPSEVDPTTPYIGLEHMPRRCISLAEWERAGKVTSGKARFRAGQILFGKLRPYFHKVGIAPLDGVCSTDIVVMAPKSPTWFGLVLSHASSDDFVAHTNACSTGTKMPRTNWRDMADYAIALPPESIAAAFNEPVSAMTELMVSGIFESRKLAQLRNYLLPKLLSGEVRVREAERAVAEAVV